MWLWLLAHIERFSVYCMKEVLYSFVLFKFFLVFLIKVYEISPSVTDPRHYKVSPKSTDPVHLYSIYS